MNIREQARHDLREWFNKDIVDPAVKQCKEGGMNHDEINEFMNNLFFETFRGLHGFKER